MAKLRTPGGGTSQRKEGSRSLPSQLSATGMSAPSEKSVEVSTGA